MEAGVLSRYLKKVKQFAKENSQYAPATVVRIVGTEKQLTLFCTDGSCGIEQHVPIVGIPIIGTCCVNVFQLSKVIDRIEGYTDLTIEIGSKLVIKSEHFKIPLALESNDNWFELPKPEEWVEVSKTFFDELAITIPDLEVEDKDYPIVRTKDQVYWANPRRLIIIDSEVESPEFLLDKVYAKKIFIDSFKQIGLNEKNVFFKNENCQIFVGQFSVSKKLNLAGPLRIMNEQHIHKCRVQIEEFVRVYDIVKSLADIDQNLQRRIEFVLRNNYAKVIFYDSEFELSNVMYDGPNVKLLVPLVNLQIITRPSFIKDNGIFTFKIAEENRMFVTQKENVFFVGGLWSGQS